jgi:hypothetical protein
MSSFAFHRCAALFSIVFAVAGCSSTKDVNSTHTSKNQSDGGAPESHCIDMRDQCLASQQICVVGDSGEKCQSCSPGEYSKDPDTCAKIPGDVMPHDFGTYQLGPGEEDNSLCQSWTLGNDTELWVNTVELETSGGYHHSNWLFAPDTKYVGPDGLWKCADRGYSELDAAVAGGVLFAQSTQAKRQVQKFPDGVAVRLPPHARIVGGVHLYNTSSEPLDTTLQLSIYTLPVSDVRVPLAPFRLSYLDLTIPPMAISEFSSACDLAGALPGDASTLDMDLYYVLPHYHSLGHSFHLEIFGGENDGKAIYDLGAFDGEAHGTPFDPPVSMSGAKGFRFSCGYENPRSVQVGWGIGDQEMCVLLGFARSDYAFDASVSSGAATANKGNIREFTGTCGVLPLDFARGQGELSPMPGTQQTVDAGR